MIFISHTATDQPFARAIESAIHRLLPKLEVSYSTSSEAGPQGGEKWRAWIDSQILGASSIIVIVSPEAIGKIGFLVSPS